MPSRSLATPSPDLLTTPTTHTAPTANDRFKAGFSAWFWIGLVAATVLHALFFVAGPSFALAVTDRAPTALDVFRIPEVPPPPDAHEIPRPLPPNIVDDIDLPDDLTLPPTTGDAFDRIAPPAPRRDDVEQGPFVTPMTRRPALLNHDDMARALERHYPAALRQAGMGGTVTVWFFIDENGRVRSTRIQQSSGFDELDGAALRVADAMRFAPAYNLDRPVPVWVAIPITFEAR